MIASEARQTNAPRPEPSPSTSGRISILTVGRSWICPDCGGRRLISVSEHGGEVGHLEGGDGSCFGRPEGTCMWAANRDRIEFGRRARKAAQI